MTHFKNKLNLKTYLTVGIAILLFQIGFAQSPMKPILPEPIPAWVKAYPKPILENKYDIDLVLIQTEEQFNHITKEFFNIRFYYVNTIF